MNVYQTKHDFVGSNLPENHESVAELERIISDILIPVEHRFGDLDITYGFKYSSLSSYTQRCSPFGTITKLGQHSSCEQNTSGNSICERGGLVCDFVFNGTTIFKVAKYIIGSLRYDKLYFYSDKRTLDVSTNINPARHLQIMEQSTTGWRYPGRKEYGEMAIEL
ncbi:MAG: hypothetical protein ACSHWP_00100 [Pseudoalteromonas sp.]